MDLASSTKWPKYPLSNDPTIQLNVPNESTLTQLLKSTLHWFLAVPSLNLLLLPPSKSHRLEGLECKLEHRWIMEKLIRYFESFSSSFRKWIRSVYVASLWDRWDHGRSLAVLRDVEMHTWMDSRDHYSFSTIWNVEVRVPCYTY